MSKLIHDKLDKIIERIGNIDVTLVEQEVQLREHIRRTEILEKQIIPVEEKLLNAEGVVKFILVLAACAALVELFLRP